ncbi:MAG TPA: mechanosensitive ion channel family protein [bacterium]|nr:mechanosensitive ion channel family protein [bacterium]
MEPTGLIERAVSIELFAHQWGIVLFAVALILYRFLAGRIKSMPFIPTGLLLLYLALRLILSTMPEGSDGKLVLLIDVASATALAFAAIRVLFSLTVETWYWWRHRTHIPRITRDLVLLVAFSAAFLVILRIRGGVNLVGLITTSAVLTAVVGLAAQNFLGNIFSSLTIQIEQPFRIGDWIEYSNAVGKVVSIGWQTTHIMTFEEELVIIPNLDVAKAVVKNHSRPTKRHAMKIEIGVEYGAAPATVRDTLMALCRQEPRVLADPKPEIRVTDYGDFAITYQMRFFYNDFEVSPNLRADMMNSVWYGLRRAGIKIPFPIRDVQHRHVERKHEENEARRLRAEALSRLGDVPILAPLSKEALKDIAEKLSIEAFGDGEAIVHQGDPGDTLYLIREGSCDVEVKEGSGPPAVVTRLDPPSFFGEMSLLTGEPRSATVRARGETSVFSISKAIFAGVLASHPEVSENLANALASRQLETSGVVGRIREEQERHASRLLIRIKTFFGI